MLQPFFKADAKFLTSFGTIAISIVRWCRPYILFLFNFGATLSLLFSFNRELKHGHSTHVNRKWDLYVFFFLICHETKIYITNSLNRALSPRIWALYCSAEYCPSRRMQKAHPFLTWSPKPASRARRLKLWYPVHAGLNPQVFFTFLKLLKSNK